MSEEIKYPLYAHYLDKDGNEIGKRGCTWRGGVEQLQEEQQTVKKNKRIGFGIDEEIDGKSA